LLPTRSSPLLERSCCGHQHITSSHGPIPCRGACARTDKSSELVRCPVSHDMLLAVLTGVGICCVCPSCQSTPLPSEGAAPGAPAGCRFPVAASATDCTHTARIGPSAARRRLIYHPRDKIRLLGFTNDTTRMLHDSTMLGPSHPDTNARLTSYLILSYHPNVDPWLPPPPTPSR
jgi:hypothetical protein